MESQAILNLVIAKAERNGVPLQTHLLIELQYHVRIDTRGAVAHDVSDTIQLALVFHDR